MASCTQITSQLQTYIDGELGASERAIFKQHLTECRACKKQMREVQRNSAFLFEAYSEARLEEDLTVYVLDHLPEMEYPEKDVARHNYDVADLNFRAKHPGLKRERAVRLLPVAAAVLLIFLAAILSDNWPAAALAPDTVGVVAYTQGNSFRIEDGATRLTKAEVGTFASLKDRYETGDNSSLMLRILGPTDLRLAANTKILLHNDRKVSVETGRVFFNVDGDKRLFKVLTPSGDITVFGTSFDLRVDSQRTTVTVLEGEVQLGSAADEGVFSIIRPGQSASVSLGQTSSIHPSSANMAFASQWAQHILADEGAEAVFSSRILPLQTPTEVAGRSGYLVDMANMPLQAIIIKWDGVSPFAKYAGYDMYVYSVHNDRYESLFQTRIDGSVFSEPNVTSYEIDNTSSTRENLSHIFVKLVPVDGTAQREVAITSLTARIGL